MANWALQRAVRCAALVFALGAPQEFARQLYLPESLMTAGGRAAAYPQAFVGSLEVRTLPTRVMRGRTCQKQDLGCGLSSHKAAE
jgi:hypothetical protein